MNAKTLSMRLDYVLFELHKWVQEERSDAKLRGPRISPHLEFFIESLETKLTEIKEHLPKINYIEIE